MTALRRTILVTGAGGLLGSALRQAVPPDGWKVVGCGRAELDIADLGGLSATLDAWRPQVVINAAGYTNVDGAERESLQALRSNVTGPATLAAETAARGGTLIHLSTDHVFDGRATRPYQPADPTAPPSLYGLSKRDGEEWVRRLQPRHWIVRTAGLFGEGGRNFVAAIVGRARTGQGLKVVADQVCARTYAPDLATALLELAVSTAAFGTYHVTNSGACSWYDFAESILDHLRSKVPLEAVTSEAWGAPAARPAYSVLDTASWAEAGLTALRPVDEAVEEYLKVFAHESV